MSSVAECTDLENTKLKSKKIRIYPTTEQKEKLRQWLGTSRYTYNKTIEYLKQPDTMANWYSIKVDIINSLPEWAKAVPYQIKSVAIRDACQAVKNAKVKFKKMGLFQSVVFRTRKNTKQSFFLPLSAVKNDGFYKTLLGMVKCSEPIEASHDCRMIYQQGRWFVTVPVDREIIHSENQGKIVSLDPGIRTFQTYYSVDSCGKIGEGDFQRIFRLSKNLDDLISRMAVSTSKPRRRIKKASDRLRWKIRDLINELHHKSALFFVTNFDLILLPIFETSRMALKIKRKIRSKTVRAMLSFAHYRFQQFLIHKATEHGKKVLLVNEAYTSKTCSWNGVIKQIGGSKKIQDAGIVLDRDYNGARGIFIRALVDQPSLIHYGRAFVNES
jgi:putative transposase